MGFLGNKNLCKRKRANLYLHLFRQPRISYCKIFIKSKTSTNNFFLSNNYMEASLFCCYCKISLKLVISPNIITPMEINIFSLCFVVFLLENFAQSKKFRKWHLSHLPLFTCPCLTDPVKAGDLLQTLLSFIQ